MFLDKLYNEDTLKGKDQTAINVARFWLDAAHDLSVKTKLQEEDIPIKLYKMLREKDPKADKIINSNGSDEYKRTIVRLILNVSAGHEKSEK